MRSSLTSASIAKHLALPVKILIPAAISTVFLRLNAKLDDANPYGLYNFLLLALIFAAFLVPGRGVKETIPGKIISYLFLLLVPISHLCLVELLMPRTRDIVTKMLYLNIIFYYLAFLLLLFFFRQRSHIAVLIGTLLSWLCGTVNCVAWAYRSLPVLPWDLYSAKTALSVASEYEFEYTHLFYTVQLAFLCIAILGFRLRLPHVIPQKAIHWSITGVLCAALCGFLVFLQTDAVFTKFGGYRYLFTPTVYYERNGAAVSFLSTLHYLNVEKPSDYNAAALNEKAEEYRREAAAQRETVQTEDLPNIIVIMNEAFSDLRTLCDYTTNLPITEHIDALSENTIRGNLHVSVKGGNTANSEYEFLSGDTMAFLPAGSIPYQQHIKSETPTLTSHLKSLGYKTEALHPYYASGWMRDKVYPYFSFDQQTFIDGFQPLYTSHVLRGYVSDKTLFGKLIDRYEENLETEEHAPLFLFAVTMQNHGGYDTEYANFHPDVTAEGLEGNQRISAYLSLIRKTDEAFGNLISYFTNAEEKTVIVMFGDHQPNDNVVSALMKQNGADASASALDAGQRYITPYILWANYDLDMEAVGTLISEKDAETKGDAAPLVTNDISVNYLSTLLCTAAGVPRSGYQNFLSDLMKEYPVITGKTVIDGETGAEYEVDALDEMKKQNDLLAAYQAFAYNHIFDAKHRIMDFFD